MQAQLPALPALQRGVKQAPNLLTRLFRGFDGSLALRLWNGTTLRLVNAGHDNPRPSFMLVCPHPSVVRSMVLGRGPLRLAEAYLRGGLQRVPCPGPLRHEVTQGTQGPAHRLRLSGRRLASAGCVMTLLSPTRR